MRRMQSVLLVASAAFAAPGLAAITVTPALVSDYDFRGISQSAKDPAVQLGIDYLHEPSGIYVGLWGSTIDFHSGDPHLETDLSAGVRWGDPSGGIAFDAGGTWYTYAGASEFNYGEVHLGASSGWLGAKIFYSPRFNGVHESAWYVAGDARLPLAAGFDAQAHIGYSGGDYWNRFYGDGYFDWSVGVSKRLGPVQVALSFVDGSDLPDGDDAGCTALCDYFSTDARVIASISTTLPWAAD